MDVIDEINEVRTNPKAYAEKIEKLKGCFKGKVLRLPGSKVGIMTTEGAKAYEECVTYLQNADPVEKLESSRGLNNIAKEFLSRVQQIDPEKIGDIDMDEIIEKNGSFVGNFSRAIDFGGVDAQSAIANLLVCDGDSSRGQRESLFNNNIHFIGAASGKHKTYGTCTVIVSATKFTDKMD